jgi:FAD/FMN-containing dehydrogenase
MRKIGSWGHLYSPAHNVVSLNHPDQTARQVQDSKLPGIAHGMGRSYGDEGLNPGGTLWTTTSLDHFESFDEQTGHLTCESGVLLRDIQNAFITRGWMLPVTPGTQFVTVGGAIANDVHGKNHHIRGSFCNHVLSLDLLRTNGNVMHCSQTGNAEYFAATAGGMGLTGIITRAEIGLIRTPSPWLETQTIPFTSIDSFLLLSDESKGKWEYTVSWIDCLSGRNIRGLFMRANPIGISSGPSPRSNSHSVPLTAPISLVNRLTLRGLNSAYYHMNARNTERKILHYKSFFYPLDHLANWNRMYGPEGFFQYQSVIPHPAAKHAISMMLQAISQAGQGSFLTVLKDFGEKEALGMMSFPMPGVTFALDFPNYGATTHKLFRRLDTIVQEAGGRLYTAKDARMPRELFEAGYPRLKEFTKYRDPGISSAMSKRLMGN